MAKTVFDPELHAPSDLQEMSTSVEAVKGLEVESLTALDTAGKLERTIIHKIGVYDRQTLHTILRTKLWDLEQGLTYEDFGLSAPLTFDGSAKSICFWAFNRSRRNANLPATIRELPDLHTTDTSPSDGKPPLFSGMESQFVLMPLTSSPTKGGHLTKKVKGERRHQVMPDTNPEPGESIDSFYSRFDARDIFTVKRFKLDGQDTYKYPYPGKDNLQAETRSGKKLFPEIAQTASHAFLVSGLYLAEEWVDEKIYESFTHFDIAKNEANSASVAFGGQLSTGCVVRNQEIPLTVYTDKTCAESDDTTKCQRWVIARIEYPYIVEVQATLNEI